MAISRPSIPCFVGGEGWGVNLDPPAPCHGVRNSFGAPSSYPFPKNLNHPGSKKGHHSSSPVPCSAKAFPGFLGECWVRAVGMGQDARTSSILRQAARSLNGFGSAYLHSLVATQGKAAGYSRVVLCLVFLEQGKSMGTALYWIRAQQL